MEIEQLIELLQSIHAKKGNITTNVHDVKMPVYSGSFHGCSVVTEDMIESERVIDELEDEIEDLDAVEDRLVKENSNLHFQIENARDLAREIAGGAV